MFWSIPGIESARYPSFHSVFGDLLAARQLQCALGMSPTLQHDPQAQLRKLYQSLLEHQSHFDEFKQLLSLYDAPIDQSCHEPPGAAEVRSRLNARIREWVGPTFGGLSALQMIQWRAIVVDERLNVSLSPWKESNIY